MLLIVFSHSLEQCNLNEITNCGVGTYRNRGPAKTDTPVHSDNFVKASPPTKK